MNYCVSDKNNKNNKLEVLRCFAFLGVFLGHAIPEKIDGLHLGYWSVSIFLILNGFLMVYNYYGKKKIECVSLKDNIIFAYKKINKLYLLHALTTIFFVVLIIGGDTVEYSVAIIKLMMNLLLLNEYIPSASLNPPAWFLCTLLLSYFIFPWILRKFEKNYSIRKAYILILCAIFFQLVIGIVGNQFSNITINNSLMDRDVSVWFIYCYPLSRIWDVIIGYNLGYIFVNSKDEASESKCNRLELIAVVSNIAVITASTAMDIPVWIQRVLIYTIPSCLLVYSFAKGKGKVSNFLVGKITMYIARISPYGYLIHPVVFGFITFVYYHVPFITDPAWFERTYAGWIRLTVGFVFTVIASEVWMRIVNKKR